MILFIYSDPIIIRKGFLALYACRDERDSHFSVSDFWSKSGSFSSELLIRGIAWCESASLSGREING